MLKYCLFILWLFEGLALAQTAPASSNSDDIPSLRAKAEAGDPEAEDKLSRDYFAGTGVQKDENKAFDWALESAIQGNSSAGQAIEYMYEQGFCVHRNPVKAFEWSLRFAESGDRDAECYVGWDYSHGCGTKINISLGNYWYKKAAIQGQTKAKWLYGIGAYGNASSSWIEDDPT